MHQITSSTPSAVADELRAPLHREEPFFAFKGKLTGCPVRATDTWSDDLFGEASPDSIALLRGDRPTFIVWSYGTPIAWLPEDYDREKETAPGVQRPVWHIDSARYSATTGRHRNIVGQAVAHVLVDGTW